MNNLIFGFTTQGFCNFVAGIDVISTATAEIPEQTVCEISGLMFPALTIETQGTQFVGSLNAVYSCFGRSTMEPAVVVVGRDPVRENQEIRINRISQGEIRYSPDQPWHAVEVAYAAVREYHKAYPRTGFKQCAWVSGKLADHLDYIILPDSADVFHGQILTPDEFKAITGLDVPADVAWRYVVECD